MSQIELQKIPESMVPDLEAIGFPVENLEDYPSLEHAEKWMRENTKISFTKVFELSEKKYHAYVSDSDMAIWPKWNKKIEGYDEKVHFDTYEEVHLRMIEEAVKHLKNK